MNCADYHKAELREADIRDAIYSYLDVRFNQPGKGLFWRDRQGVKKPRMGTLARSKGVADILGVWGGIAVAIEVKKPDAQGVSLAQFQWGDRFRKSGGIYFIATSVRECEIKIAEIEQEMKSKEVSPCRQ